MKFINKMLVLLLALGFFSAQAQASCGLNGCDHGVACADGDSAFGYGKNLSINLHLKDGVLVVKSASGQTLDQVQCTRVINEEHFDLNPEFSNIDCKSKVFMYSFKRSHLTSEFELNSTVALKDVLGRVYHLRCNGYVYAKK